MRRVSCFFRAIGFRPRRTTARANISGVIIGMSEKSISSSFIACSRFQSVSDFFEVDDFLILMSLPSRNNSDRFVGFGVRKGHYYAIQQTQREKPSLSIRVPII